MTPAIHGEREEHYRKQLGVYDLPMGQRAPLADLAWQMATAEMLDEVHEMLRALTKEPNA